MDRVLIVSAEHWPRALLRAELLERGYQAAGATGLAEAMIYPREKPGYGPVRLIVVDQQAMEREGPEALRRLVEMHDEPRVILVASAKRAAPSGPWSSVLRRPVRISTILGVVEEMLPPPRACGSFPDGDREVGDEWPSG